MIELYSNKKGNSQTHGNFTTTQLIIKFSRTVLWVCGVSPWLRTRSLTRSTFSLSRVLRGPPLSASLLTALVYANVFSSLLMLLFVQHLFENLFVNFISLYPFFKWYKFLIKILASVLCKFSRKKLTSFGCQPLDDVTRGGPPSDATAKGNDALRLGSKGRYGSCVGGS